jgi:arachidonate 15-lipoxygenase
MKELFTNLPDAPAPNASRRSIANVVSDDWKYIYAPYAAFVLAPDGKHIWPVAIQCGPKSEGHQIYTPKDGYSWKMAKTCVLAAHNNHHEVVSHLGLTHLLVDPIIMATRKCLHRNHPVYKLLNPHFEGTASVNIGARTSLILPGRSVDRLVGSKIENNYPYLAKSRLNHSFRDNFPKVRLAARGLDSEQLLPNYPYRDDAFLLWDAIHNWISDYVSIWYKSEADIQADFEIQAWANEVNGPGKVKDFCLTGGGVKSRDDLIDLLTMTIFTAGPQHAAVNFTQGSDMSFVPANPLGGYAQAPSGTGHTEQDFLNILPPLDVAIHTWAILNLLAGVNNTRLGDYRMAFMTNPFSEAARLKFWANLQIIELKIKASNRIRRQVYELEYAHLLPSRVPASINI